MWKDIGRNILKGTIVTVGTKIMSEKVVPAASEFGKEAWDRIKNTKSTGKEKEEEEKKEEQDTHKPAKMKVVDSSGYRKIYDADFTSEGQQ